MLNFRHPRQLSNALEVPLGHLLGVLEHADDYYEEFILLDPRRPTKRRQVVNPRGRLRALQRRFYQNVLTTALRRSSRSHGGVPGRNILTNVRPHLGQSFVYTTDLEDFYPNIHRKRITNLFTRLGCSAQVASLCTRVCTYRHCLSQGLITSPILADHLMLASDKQIMGIKGIIYTRFMDDLAISARFDLKRSGIPNVVRGILRSQGFEVNDDKEGFGKVAEGVAITGIRFPRGHPDVERRYYGEVVRQMRDLASLGRGNAFQGPYYTQAQIMGRVRFICWVNPGRRRLLGPLLREINWQRVTAEAQERALVEMTKTLVRCQGD